MKTQHTLLCTGLLALLAACGQAPGTATLPAASPAATAPVSTGTAALRPQALAGGQVLAWGDNTSRQIEVPALPAGVTYTAMGGGYVHSVALRSDGQIVSWGDQTSVPPPPGGMTYTAVAAGGFHSLGLRSDGMVVAWGRPDEHQLDVAPLPEGMTYTSVAGGKYHSLALRSDGQVVAWGSNSSRQLDVTPLPAGMTYTAVAAGSSHSVALRSDGKVVAWGGNYSHQLDVPALPTGMTYTAVAAGYFHNLALRSDGRVVAWGRSDEHQLNVPDLPAGVTYTAVAAGYFHSLALRSDGKVVAWGNNNAHQLDVPDPPAGKHFTAVAAGAYHSLALAALPDQTPPTITLATPAQDAVYGLNQTVNAAYTCADDDSGVASCTGTAANGAAIDTGSVGGKTFTVESADNAGNKTSKTVTYTVDGTPPVITPTVSGTKGMGGWYTGNVNVKWTVTDPDSAVTSTSGCDEQNVTTDTTADGTTYTCTATSAGGQSTQSVTVKRDTTAPTITFANRTAANATGWNNSAVTVNWTCADATSGVVNPGVSQTISTENANQSATGTCTDGAGNTATNTQGGINIDTTAPKLDPKVTPNPVFLGSTATATPNASDLLSGLASSSCGSVTTSSVGSQSVSCTATDKAGNTATLPWAYTVIYTFRGFLQPVDNLPTINTVKAGSSIPVKFSLSGNQGLNILAAGSPTVKVVPCDGSAPSDEIEQTLAASNSSLTYDAASDTYSYVWKTDKSWAGSCRQLNVLLTDGTPHLANFRFR